MRHLVGTTGRESTVREVTLEQLGSQLVEEAVHKEKEVHEEVHEEVLEPRAYGCYACLRSPARCNVQILPLDRSQTAHHWFP